MSHESDSFFLFIKLFLRKHYCRVFNLAQMLFKIERAAVYETDSYNHCVSCIRHVVHSWKYEVSLGVNEEGVFVHFNRLQDMRMASENDVGAGVADRFV